MCGICGVLNFSENPVAPEAIRTMMGRIKHRGPDDEGMFLDDSLGLGHVRLSILDLSAAGRQPMFSRDGRYAIVYNGEVYNYLELRNELRSDFNFETNTDTEVILAAFQKWGIECLHKFNGMWAFAIYDTWQKELLLARDRYGIKPLYYYLDKSTLIFASEINALLPLLPVTPVVDEKIMYEYLVYSRTDQSCDTFLHGIKRLQHGFTACANKDGFSTRPWYTLADKIGEPWKNPEEFRSTFSSSVGIRLRSDVPVGVCLSGGLDSSSVTSCVMQDHNLADLYTFSAVYRQGEHGDERIFVDEYKDVLANLKYVFPTAESFYQDFEDFLECHFEPLHHLSIYSQFKVLKEASNFVTVLLDGQGADEQLAGYHYFFASYFRELLRNLKLLSATKQIYHYLQQHRSTLALRYLAFYVAPGGLKNYAGSQKAGWLSREFCQRAQKLSDLNVQLFDPASLIDSLLQHFEYKLEHNLKWNDLNSMYFSLELREPFLDYRIVERTLSSPSHSLIRNGYTKWILREAMRDVLPEPIRSRQDKVGFDNPSDKWFRSPKSVALVHEVLASQTLLDCGYLDIKECREKYNDHLAGRINITKDIWKWVNVYYFLKRISYKGEISWTTSEPVPAVC